MRRWQFALLTTVARDLGPVSRWAWPRLPKAWRMAWANVALALSVRSLHVGELAEWWPWNPPPSWVPCNRCGGNAPCRYDPLLVPWGDA